MDAPLLATKLMVPPAKPGLVARPRLFERLDAAFSYGLVVVSAPAGFGKTTLISEWTRLSQIKGRAAWVSLDEGDNDPVRFWDYFIAALQTIQPGCGEKVVPWLHSSGPPSTKTMLNILINDLSRSKGDFAIVLDDYHLIESKEIHDGIAYLTEHLPSQLHMVIAARADPPVPLARFRGKGVMLEIRTDDLRFNLEEAANLLKELKTPDVAASDVEALGERTDGWAVGLKMAALSMAGHEDIPGFIAAFTGSQRYVMDYLMEEVLQKQPPELREFLLTTSVLDRLTGPLCDVIAGRERCEEILLRLERGHLFVVPLDDSRRWYRYEHLFADLLRNQCETVYGKQRVAALHQQASEWYEDNDLPEDAIRHALAARDWPRAIRLICGNYEDRLKRGQFKTVLDWCRAIPDPVLREHPRVYSQYAAVLAHVGPLDAADLAIGYIGSAALDDTALQGEVAYSAGAVCGRRGDMERYLELSEKAFSLLSPDNVVMRSRAAWGIAHARQRLVSLEQTESWATKAYELGRQAGDIWVATGGLGLLGNVAAYRGNLRRATEMYEKAIESAGQAGALIGPHDTLAMVYYILNDLEGVALHARLAIQWGKLGGGMAAVMVGHFYQAQVCLTHGDSAGASAAMEKMELASHDPTIDSFWYADYIACRVMYAIRIGKLDEAATWGERLPDIDNMIAIDWHVPARLLLAKGDKEAAVGLLSQLHDRLVRSGAVGLAIRIRVYQALAAENEALAMEFLTEALAKAEEEGAIRFFVDEGPLLRPLLRRALERGVTRRFTRRLLDIIDEEERNGRWGKGAPVAPSPSILSGRELEVLRLVADDNPNQRIAGKLNVSLGTIKTHVHHIIDKLEVKDRRQAVQRAKDLKLL